MGPVNYAGVALQIAGLAISGVGLWRTWREFARTEDRFLGPVIDPVREAFAAFGVMAEAFVRRALRRPRMIVAEIASAQGLVISSARANVRVGYGSPPNDVPEALAELHRRTQELMAMFSKVDERLAKENEDRDGAISAVRSEVDAAVKRLDARGQRIAVGGIRTQGLGVFLVALGLVLQAWPF